MSQTKAQLIEGLNINTSAPADALVIDSSGNVGIGTTSPINALHINGAANNVASRIRISSTEGSGLTLRAESATASMINVDSSENLLFGVGGSEVARIDSSGNVGIGLSSPTSRLHVDDTTSTITLESDASNDVQVRFQQGSTFVGAVGYDHSESCVYLNRFGNATQGLVVDNSGNVGIGVSSPNTPLAIASNASTYEGVELVTPSGDGSGVFTFGVHQSGSTAGRTIAFARGGSDGHDTESLRIDASGRLLVGTSSGDSSVHLLQISGNTSGNTGGNISLSRGAIPTAVNQTLGLIAFGDGGGDVYAEVKAQCDGAAASGDAPGRLVFLTTADGASSSTERMRIDSSGRVLIGTTTEGQANTDDLTVASSGNTGITIRAGTSNNAAINFSDATSGAGEYAGAIDYNHGTNAMQLFTNSTERMRIDSSGDVGIGTDNPVSVLHVNKNSTNNTPLSHNYPATQSGIVIANHQTGTTGAFSAATLRAYNSSSVQQSASIIAQSTGSGFSPSLLFTQRSGHGTNAERMRIDSSGRLLVGTSSAGAGDPQYSKLQVVGNSLNDEGFFRIGRNENTGDMSSNDVLGRIFFTDGSGDTYAKIDCICDGTPGSNDFPGRLAFSTTADGASSPTERMRITSNGEQRHFGTLATNLNIANSASANTNNEFLYCQHSSTGLANGTNSFRVTTNGNVTNTNNSYGAISDQNLKENIVDATSQWNDIKGLQVRKYNFRENTGHETYTQLGLIAQEAESVSPGLVQTTPVKEGETVLDADGNQLESIKSINYSVLYMKAVKALQEAQTRIETLETQNTAQQAQIDDLLARVTALEAG